LAGGYVAHQRQQAKRSGHSSSHHLYPQSASGRQAHAGRAGYVEPARPYPARGCKLPTGHPVFTGAIKAPSKAATAEYGEYILSYHDCRDCHGADLQGGVLRQLGTIGPGLAIVKDWKLEDFIATLRTGIDPNGYHLDGNKMPWRWIGKMDDEELGAIYAYLKRLPDP
jgi:hypothetical protein